MSAICIKNVVRTDDRLPQGHLQLTQRNIHKRGTPLIVGHMMPKIFKKSSKEAK
jgi:hypothetical protein